MGTGFLYGGGSLEGLHYRILGGLEAPKNPREGDIWLKTEEPITGYTITSWTRDDLEDLEEKGHVYIGGGDGEAKAKIAEARTGAVEIVPFRHCQYDGEKWTALELSLYRNGDWINLGTGWDGELYSKESISTRQKEINHYAAFTGGWTYRYAAEGEQRLYQKTGLGFNSGTAIHTRKAVLIPKEKRYLYVKGQSKDVNGNVGTIVLSTAEDPDDVNGKRLDYAFTSYSGPATNLARIPLNGEEGASGRQFITILPPSTMDKSTMMSLSKVWME